MPAAAPDLPALRRASRTAGLLTLGGAVVVLASIGYSVVRLSDTEQRLAAEKAEADRLRGEVETLNKVKADLAPEVDALTRQKAELATQVATITAQKRALEDEVAAVAAQNRRLKGQADRIESVLQSARPKGTKGEPPPKDLPLELQVKGLVAEKGDLDRQVGVLRKEATVIRDELRQRFADPAKSLELWENKPEYRGVMTTVLVAPESRYVERDDPTSPTGRWYLFTLGLEFPRDPKLARVVKRDIKSVTYNMNHPYRKVDPLVSKDADDDFAVRYEGAGTLPNVVVSIDVAGLGPVQLDYDMTKAHPAAKKK